MGTAAEPNVFAIVVHSAVLREWITTRAPSRANARAMPRPMPFVDPVTSVCLPARLTARDYTRRFSAAVATTHARRPGRVARARQDSERGGRGAGAEAAAHAGEAAECSAAPSRRARVAQSRAAVWYSPAGAEAAACRTRDWSNTAPSHARPGSGCLWRTCTAC